MKGVWRLWVLGLVLFASFGLRAQVGEEVAKQQDDFALAAATAHVRTSLFVAGSKPFRIRARVVSSLALRGTGEGTYENEWLDAQHWHRVIRFADFEQTEMRNDAGHSWVDQTSETVPLRVQEMLRVVVIHVPSSTSASHIPVTESSATGDQGEPLTCYSAAAPTTTDGFARRARWCFEKESGLLVSQDMPLNTHIVYSRYVAFQGKQEFTHVRVTAGGLPALEIEVEYAPLDAHGLDGAVPEAGMHRSASAAGSGANPEELRKGTVEYSYSPLLPAGTPESDKNRPVQVQFEVSADNRVLDACVEDAPTQAMAEAGLEGARRFTFSPLLVDGKAVGNRFYYSVWFRSGADGAIPAEAAGGPEGAKGEVGSTVAGAGPGRVFESREPAFAFRYPAGFEQFPRAEMEDALRTGKLRQGLGLEPGARCNTVLFKAQKLRPGERVPDVVSITDLAPMCIYGLVDQKALEAIAVNAGRSILAQFARGNVGKPKSYRSGGHMFAVVSVSGMERGTGAEEMRSLVVLTKIYDHVVGWTVVGPAAEDLVRILGACTLQIGNGAEMALLPASVRR